ncbi:hypothetical protein WJ98_27530 [Burkholderia ubonensis]|nr:hypothetical protein WJ98_27530 [Burkholderia ubonensis]
MLEKSQAIDVPLLTRGLVYTIPYIWSPYFIERDLDVCPKLKARLAYRNSGRAKRIALFEPKLNVLNSAVVSMLAVNKC